MTLTLSKGERIGGLFFLLAQFLAVPVAVTLICGRTPTADAGSRAVQARH